jgi:hypothetical protein
MGDSWRDRLQVSADGIPSESIGAPISAGLAAGLAAIDLGAEAARTEHATVIQTGVAPGTDRLRARLAGVPSRWIDLATSASWNSDSALNAAVVPMDVVQAIVTRVEELSP